MIAWTSFSSNIIEQRIKGTNKHDMKWISSKNTIQKMINMAQYRYDTMVKHTDVGPVGYVCYDIATTCSRNIYIV
jgi:hypothetical protein